MKVVTAGKRLTADLLGRHFIETVRIDRVLIEKCGADPKPVMYFEGHDRALVLNATNIDTLVALFGTDESDLWLGRSIQLFTTMTTFQGKQTLGIRVRGAHPVDPPARAARPREPGEDDGPVQASQLRW